LKIKSVLENGILLKTFHVTTVLGWGGNGSVVEGVYHTDILGRQQFAIKLMYKYDQYDENGFKKSARRLFSSNEIPHEKTLLERLSKGNQHIIKYVDFLEDDYCYYLVMGIFFIFNFSRKIT
jgi:serine/threonine protein kinase